MAESADRDLRNSIAQAVRETVTRVMDLRGFDTQIADAVLAVLPAPTDQATTLRDFLWRLEQSAGDATAEKLLDDNPDLRRLADEAQHKAAAPSAPADQDADREKRYEAGMRRIPGWSSGKVRIRDAAIAAMTVADAEQQELRAKVYEWQGSYLDEVKARQSRNEEVRRLRAELETARKVEQSDTARLTRLEGDNARLRAEQDDWQHNLAQRAFTAPDADLDTILTSLDARIRDAHADKATVLREAANGLAALGPVDSLVSAPAAWTEAIETLRRMADQIQQDGGAR